MTRKQRRRSLIQLLLRMLNEDHQHELAARPVAPAPRKKHNRSRHDAARQNLHPL
jgi:hypothetical protein